MFDRSKELEKLMNIVRDLAMEKDNPFSFMAKMTSLSDHLEDIYNKGYEEGRKVEKFTHN